MNEPTESSVAEERASARVPKYRSDAKGNLAALIKECADTMCGEMRLSPAFYIEFGDCVDACEEYALYLTDAELARAFKRALKASP